MTEFNIKIPTIALVVFTVIYALNTALKIYSVYLDKKIKKLNKNIKEK